MGYGTKFNGQFSLTPPLTIEQNILLKDFTDKRHENIVFDTSPFGEPLNVYYCPWAPTGDGEHLVYDGGENPYSYVEWLCYLRDNFLNKWGVLLGGSVRWQGDEVGDAGIIYTESSQIEAVKDTNPGPSWNSDSFAEKQMNPNEVQEQARALASAFLTQADLYQDVFKAEIDAVAQALQNAYRTGAENMRDRAAQVAINAGQEKTSATGSMIARVIRALPIIKEDAETQRPKPEKLFILAANHQQFQDYCHQHKLRPTDTVYVHRYTQIIGLRLKPRQLIRIGTNPDMPSNVLSDILACVEGQPLEKGEKGGPCNRSACLAPGADWYNSSTRAYYCRKCAMLINDNNPGTLCTLEGEANSE